MAGPTVTVLLSHELTPAQADFLGNVIHATSDDVCGDDFFVTSTVPIGGSKSFGARPFICSVACDRKPLSFGYSADELAQISDAFGVTPTSSITFAAMCNDPIDHEILARLARHIAAEFNGVIDLNGEIPLDADDHAGLHVIQYECLYKTANRHCCTPEFLDKYITHECFHMVQ